MLQKRPDTFNIIFEAVENFLEPLELTLSPFKENAINQILRDFEQKKNGFFAFSFYEKVSIQMATNKFPQIQK